VSLLETPGTTLCRPSKGAPLVAEQFALNQALWQRGHVNRYERNRFGASCNCESHGRTSSLPLPVGPSISTCAELGAGVLIPENTLLHRWRSTYHVSQRQNWRQRVRAAGPWPNGQFRHRKHFVTDSQTVGGSRSLIYVCCTDIALANLFRS
jgi:hypothetical protein